MYMEDYGINNVHEVGGLYMGGLLFINIFKYKII